MVPTATPRPRDAEPVVVPGNHDTCVVVPMYDEAGVIASVVAELRGRFDRVVCVDDGSRDASATLAAAAGADVVRHPVNLGQGAALETGIRYALAQPGVDYVVTYDADGQHSLADAEAMVRLARAEGLQVVLGSRFLATLSDVPAGRRRLLRAAVRFTRSTTGLDVTDAHNGLRVLRRDAAAGLRLRLHGMSHASEILGQVARGGYSYAEHPVTIRYTDYSRAKGQRGWNALNIVFDLVVDRLRAAA
ncbi:glycosyltransferase family 2 protein [Nocardioides sp. SYSU D00038]|uniref:glycosyltransferase family 2 protein n=1 Tax=Nocardioides sp. SYSU D00038 TaxID=2812554 RepID=UPI001967BC93|nr:glycosyltransferase family 2 protein [Nocardioides sp. SYSU D00038]